MSEKRHVALIGRDAELARFADIRRKLEHGGVGYLWITGEAGCGKSALLQAWATQAEKTGWQVLRGECTEQTRTDPYGPFLSMLGLCFDKSGKLINDRSVYSIVDQISLDDVFAAVEDIPGMSVVAFGIKVGMTIFDSRRRPQSSDDLLNRNFEFILQVLRQIDHKRKKPVLLAIEDLHLAGATTCALIEYILTRIEETRLLMTATWQAGSEAKGREQIREMSRRLAQPEYTLHLLSLSDVQMRQLLSRIYAHPLAESLVSMLIELSRGLPQVLTESLRLIELEDMASIEGEIGEADATHSALQVLTDRQLAQVTDNQRTLLECASLLNQPIPLDLLTAAPLCAYLGMSERALLSIVVELADRGKLLTWDGEDAVRFASSFMYKFLREYARLPVTRRDHLRIAQALQSIDGESRPALLAMHYLAGGDLEKALTFALQSAEDLTRSTAYPEAVQSYRLALNALEESPDQEEYADVKYDILRAMSMVAEQAGDWDESLARLEDALVLSEGDLGRQAEIYAGLGWLRFQLGQVQTALECLNHSAELYETLGDVRGQAQVDYYLGVLYGQQKEWQRAIACFERYLDTSQKADFSEGRASAYTELGNLYRLQRKWSQAETFLQKGIDLAQADGDYVVLAQGHHYLGFCYALQGKSESVETLHRALEIVRTRTKQPAQESRILNTLAETSVRQNRWQEAEAAFRASARIKERLGDKAGLAITHGGLGRLYYRQWRFDLAVEHLQKDIDLLSEEFVANIAWIQQWTNFIGEVRRLQGQLDQAAQRFADALSLANSIPDRDVQERSLGYVHMFLTNLALDKGDTDTAATECALALDSLAGTGAEGEIQRTAARLARLRGDMEQARQHLDKALAAAERGEDLDRAQTFLEQAYFYRDTGDASQTHESADQVVTLARRLQNVELERRASELLSK